MKKGKTTLVLKTANVDRRLQLLVFILIAIFSLLVFRLWNIQIYRQEEFKLKSQRNLVRLLPIPSERGQILDRNGRVLVKDVNFWNVWLPIRSEQRRRAVTPEIHQSLELLSGILEVPYDSLKNTYLTKGRDLYYKHYRVQVAKNIPFDKYVEIETRRVEFPTAAMVYTEAVPQRFYRYNELAAHVMGHTREINRRELELMRDKGYKSGDRIGSAGVEASYEEYLRGKEGINQVFVNKFEIQQGPAMEIQPAIPGNNVVMTMDYKLQLAAERILGASRGVMIAQDPRNGQILAMASSPRFDPNNYSKAMAMSSSDPNRPLYHRAIRGTYPPGSIFKIYEMLPLLETLKVTTRHTEYCPGFFYLPGLSSPWKCHKKGGHGRVNLYDAIRVSCNVFFYNAVGMKLGIDHLVVAAAEHGLTGKTEIDLPEEKVAIYPSRATKKHWYRGYTINMSIGQGETLLTPLQVSNSVSALANRGTLYKPRVIKEIRSPEGNLLKTIEPEVLGQIEAKPETWDIIHHAMWEVVNTPNGTGRRIVDGKNIEKPFILAGKTGTAEDGKIREPHAWFTCFGPYENPEIVVTVILENAGHGGEVAAPLAKKLIEVYLGRVFIEDLA